jgi:5-methylcytosine-specific restriction endonuclease McrA
MAIVNCVQCGCEKKVVPARLKTFKFCSYKCAGEWRKLNFTGDKNPKWMGGDRLKLCQGCKSEIKCEGNLPYSTFLKRKFCTKECADKHGFRYTGENHPNYREEARRKNRGGSHHKWVNAVISRDKAICQHCGVVDVELHAHHIKSYKDNPDLRFDLDNGITLCYKCHWEVHTALNEKSVNSGKLLPSNVGDNPEPSLNRKVFEGVTTRGRAYRRVVGNCKWCNEVVSRRLSDVKPSGNMFCNKHCSGKYIAANRQYKQWKNPPVMAVNSSKSAGHESDDIV